jgi:multidrug transporter EmrE-like cation transporter
VVWILALWRRRQYRLPMLSVGYVVNAVAAAWLFGEPVGVLRIAGIGVIIVGVWMVARS